MRNSLVLPLPPSLNHAYITRRGGGQRIMTDTTRKYKLDVWSLVKAAGIKTPYKKLSLISYMFFYPDNRKRDNDNGLKILRDALKGSLFVDDCWQAIEWEYLSGRIDRDNPRVEIDWIK